MNITTIAQVDEKIKLTHDKFYRTDCAECDAKVFGSYTLYQDEMRNPDAQWRCLNCGTRGFVFDDEYHEDIQKIRQMLVLLRDIIFVEWTDGKQAQVAETLREYFSQEVNDLIEMNGIESDN